MNRWNLLESDLHRLMPARSFTGSGPSLESKVNPNESDEGIRESIGVRPPAFQQMRRLWTHSGLALPKASRWRASRRKSRCEWSLRRI
jgi:hypothetical protein